MTRVIHPEVLKKLGIMIDDKKNRVRMKKHKKGYILEEVREK